MKEGKGVQKRNPDEPRLKLFFELLFRKLWNLFKLNLLYLVTAIPTFVVMMVVSGLITSRITENYMPLLAQAMGLAAPDMANSEYAMYVILIDILLRMFISLVVTVFWGMGPVTAGYTYIQRNYAREEHAWLLSDFFGKTKENFRQALAVWAIDLAAFVLLTVALLFYSELSGALSYMAYLIVFIMLIYTIMHFYIYPCMVTFKLSVKNIFRNSLIFTFSEGPRNILLVLVLAVLHIGIPYVILAAGASLLAVGIFVLVEVCLLVAVSGFIVNFAVYPSIERCIREAEGLTDDGNEAE